MRPASPHPTGTAWLLLLTLALGACDGDPRVPAAPAALAQGTIPPVESRPAPPPPKPLPPALRRVYQDISRGQFEQGRRGAESYLAAHPNDVQANLMIGLSYFRADNHGAARPYFEAAIAGDPEYYITHDYLAEASFLLGDLKAARKHYQTFRSFVPGEPRTYVRLGSIEAEESRPELAAAYYREALALFEDMRKSDRASYERQRGELASAHARLGELHFASGRYEQARQELEAATRAWPQNISAFYTLGQVYRRLGEEELAEQADRRYEEGRRMRIEGGVPK